MQAGQYFSPSVQVYAQRYEHKPKIIPVTAEIAVSVVRMHLDNLSLVSNILTKTQKLGRIDRG